jgi:hypothetical protein
MNFERHNGEAVMVPNWPEERFGEFKQTIIDANKDFGLEINANGNKVKILSVKMGTELLKGNPNLEAFIARMNAAGFDLIEDGDVKNDGNVWKEYTVTAQQKSRE